MIYTLIYFSVASIIFDLRNESAE